MNVHFNVNIYYFRMIMLLAVALRLYEHLSQRLCQSV